MTRLADLIQMKEAVKRSSAEKLEVSEIREALADSHAKREPRMCGLTVHPAKGCSIGCKYCYISDMGFRGPPIPSRLSGIQLVHAITSNPYFLPTKRGTLLAFGSITEPFLPRVRDKTVEFLEAIEEFLGNPVQLSTKMHLNAEESELLAQINPEISVLVTITTLSRADILEPAAPKPEMRFLTIRNLSENSLHASLFLRPIIPGITEEEGPKILEAAKDSGARGAVLGSLRVTPTILAELERAGFRNLSELVSSNGLKRGRQVPIDASTVKSYLRKHSQRISLRVFQAACAANIDAHSLSCHACDYGPCGDELPEVDGSDIEEGLSLLGIESEASVKGSKVYLRVRGGAKKEKIARILVGTYAKRKVLVERVEKL
mgnify:CR=1 FL=1